MKQRKRRVYCGMEYQLLASKLSPEELTCISHCAVFSDCAINGNCELQSKVDNTLKD